MRTGRGVRKYFRYAERKGKRTQKTYASTFHINTAINGDYYADYPYIVSVDGLFSIVVEIYLNSNLPLFKNAKETMLMDHVSKDVIVIICVLCTVVEWLYFV